MNKGGIGTRAALAITPSCCNLIDDSSGVVAKRVTHRNGPLKFRVVCLTMMYPVTRATTIRKVPTGATSANPE